jgi:hypothetical protein
MGKGLGWAEVLVRQAAALALYCPCQQLLRPSYTGREQGGCTAFRGG